MLIDDLDHFNGMDHPESEDSEATENNPDKDHDRATDRPESEQFYHIRLGSRQQPMSLASVEQQHDADCAFEGFQARLNRFLNSFFEASNTPRPGNAPIYLSRDFQVLIYQI